MTRQGIIAEWISISFFVHGCDVVFVSSNEESLYLILSFLEFESDI